MKDVEEFVKLLGKPNRYSALVIFLLCFMYFPMSFNHLAMAVYGAVPPHRCHIPGDVSLNDSIPRLDNGEYDSCQVYVNYTQESGKTEPCPNGWRYELLEGESTIVDEWDLVCDRFYLGPLATSFYFFGNIMGGLCLGTLSDRMGRKKVTLTVIYLHIVLGIMVYFVESFTLFVILRAMIGFCVVSAQSSLVLAIEWVRGSRVRTNINCTFEMCFSLAVITLGLIAYGLKSWRYIQLGITLPCLLFIGYIWCIPESVRWLLTKGKYKEAEKCLIRGAKFNNTRLPPDPLGLQSTQQSPDATDRDQTKYTLLDIFRNPVTRKRIIIISYAWLTTGFVYYGLSLNASAWAGNKYLNFVISGLVELPAVFAAFYVLERFGRKAVLIFYGIASGVMCIISGALPQSATDGPNLSMMASVFAWLGKLMNNGCWCVIVLYCAELFPTPMRNMAVLYCDLWARIGSALAPQIAVLAVYTADWVPTTLLGVTAIIMGCITCMLPETRQLQLPDTLGDLSRNTYTVSTTSENHQPQSIENIPTVLVNS